MESDNELLLSEMQKVWRSLFTKTKLLFTVTIVLKSSKKGDKM